MGLFDRVSRVVRAELNQTASQSISPEEGMNCAIKLLEDAVIKTKIALAKAPAEQSGVLKRNLTELEAKLADATLKRATLLERMSKASAKANDQLYSAVSHTETNSVMSGFEYMEEKVREMEARSRCTCEPTGTDLDEAFKLISVSDDVDDELAAMKAQLTGESVSQQALPALPGKISPAAKSEVDDELEALRRQIDTL